MMFGQFVNIIDRSIN